VLILAPPTAPQLINWPAVGRGRSCRSGGVPSSWWTHGLWSFTGLIGWASARSQCHQLGFGVWLAQLGGSAKGGV